MIRFFPNNQTVNSLGVGTPASGIAGDIRATSATFSGSEQINSLGVGVAADGVAGNAIVNSRLTVNGQTVFGQMNQGAYAYIPGAAGYSAAQGLIIAAKTGASYDLSIITPANGAYLATVATGTQNWVFPGNVQANSGFHGYGGGASSFFSPATANTIAASAGDTASAVWVYNQLGSGGAFMSFHRGGIFAANFGIDTDNQWKVGGWSMGAQSYVVHHEGNSPSALTTNGYQKLASGLILQWGITGAVASGAVGTITFPIAFPNAGLFCTNIPVTINAVAQTAPTCSTLTTTNSTFTNSTGISNTFRWFAVGY